MVILLFFAFLSGLVTIAAPCIWPLLPIILSSTATGEKRKPLGITLGIISSFALFTLTISYIVKIIPFDPNSLRIFAVLVIGFLGLVLVSPKLSQIVEGYVSRLSGKIGAKTSERREGFVGGYVTGFALGIVWSPCAGPILATIATLAATRSVNLEVVLVTLVYVIGVGIPLFLFALAGKTVLTKSRFLSKYTGSVQRIFGLIMILTAILIFTNYDKVLQAKLLDTFPSYSNFLYKLEGNSQVQKELKSLKNKKENNQINSIPVMNLPNLGKAPEFTGINKWLNVDKPLTLADLSGKVVLIDFWTYTCINCIRTLPHVTAWYDKYKDQGFVVVGVHTPEFEFEKNTDNVLNAIKQYGIHYPVAQDNDYKTWFAYSNQYWPAEYLIDANGNIRRTHFGEGEYDQSETAIKQLLEKEGKRIDQSVLKISDQTPKTQLTPETYMGSKRRDRFVDNNPPQDYFSLGGKWDIEDEYAQTVKDSNLDFNFYSDKVFLVITPKSKDDQIKVLLDGKPVNVNNAGDDVSEGKITINGPRLYNLINLHGQAGNHLLHLEFLTPGTQIFAFTFG